MEISARAVPVEEILPWREHYRREMACQIVHDSLHSRAGWTQPYLLSADAEAVGYGSVLIGGPWRETTTLFEYYVAPAHRSRLFDLFTTLVAASGARALRGQSNDHLLTNTMLAWSHDLHSDSIVFRDELTTNHAPAGVHFRPAAPSDFTEAFADQEGPVGDWVLDFEGAVVALGGFLLHYNPPHADLYMEVAEPFRRRGWGAYFVLGSSRVDLQACKLEYSIVSPK